ncbi:fimbrial protein [Burkholderia sp. MR1-5-21]
MNDRNTPIDRIRLACTVALLACAAGTGTAQAAANCQNASTSELGTLPDPFRIAADAPIGTVLWSKTGIDISASCMKTVGSANFEATLYRWMADSDLTSNGLGLYVTYNGNRGTGAGSFPMGKTISSSLTWTTVSATIDVELVKTGATPSRPTPFPVLSVLTALIGGPNKDYSKAARYVTYGFKNISFQAATCAPSSTQVAVDLGTHKLSKSSGLGSGIGATSSSKSFTIGLKCDADVAGSFAVHLTLDGSAYNASDGILSLSSSSTAKGVGIQLLKGDGKPVPLGKSWKVTDMPPSSTLSVPLTARYYQTASSASPGTANGTATFTISYK